MTEGVLYLRSSKDRSDVSIAAQRRELETLAADRGIRVVDVYQDVVESAKTDDRPAFQRLTRAIRDTGRGWNIVLVLDHSRIARNRMVAQAFRYECQTFGVDLVYAHMPNVDPVSAVLLESIFEAMAEAHSLMSRDKGLAGMRENVRQGWRAGGRAPAGYQLEHVATGAIRDGKPVLKSRLVTSPQARTVAQYLRRRAMGEPRAVVRRDMGLRWATSTLVCMEWNALTYAGHTVWNRHADKKDRGKGKPKRRPRGEWVIERGTHEPLISDAEAEALLAALESSEVGKAVARAKAGMSDYLLTGLLVTPEGDRWIGQGGNRYRLKAAEGRRGKYLDARAVDEAVLGQIAEDMRSEAFIGAITDAAREAGGEEDPAAPLRRQLDAVEREKDRAARLALTVDDGGTFAALVGEKSREIEALRREIAAVTADDRIAAELRKLTPTRVRALLLEMGSPRAVLQAMVERIELTAGGECRIIYRLPRLSMASPRGTASWTACHSTTYVRLLA